MMSVMGLWSCSNDEMLPGGSDLQGHPVTLTLTVNRGDAQTRTELSENTQTGGLNDVWVSGDVLHVYDKTGEEVGTLDLIDGPNTSVGVFKGTVNATQGEQELAIWYYGDVESNPNLSFTKYSGRNGLKVDLHTQNFADVKSLSALDILSKKVTLNVNGENSTVVKDEVMEAHLAMAKFSLAGLPEGTKGTLNIYNVDGYGSNSISGEEYYNTLNTTTLDFARVGQAQTSSDKNPIVVENVVADQYVYVAFVPSSYKLGFIFTASNGDVYRYAFENSTILEAGKYYTAFNGEGDVIDGVNIPLTKDIPSRYIIRYHSNYGSDDVFTIEQDFNADRTVTIDKTYTQTNLPQQGVNKVCIGWSTSEDGKVNISSSLTLEEGQYEVDVYAVWYDQSENPLDKWATGNLVYNKSTGKSTIGSATGGSLYQWGRNYGYADYKEARGALNSNSYEYAVAGVTACNSGLGLLPNSYNLYVPQLYNANTPIKNHTQRFLINAVGDDYWIWAAGGDTWEERANSNGYSSNSPCPDDWRIPTKEDFMEICPVENSYSGSGNLTTLLKGSFERKTINKQNNNLTYIIRWDKKSGNDPLEIRAIVVPSDFDVKYKDLMDWDCTIISDTYKRSFGYTGTINCVYDELRFPGNIGTDNVVGPLPVGPNQITTYYYTSGRNRYYYNKYDYITDWGPTLLGNYWMSDNKGGAFRFVDKANHADYGENSLIGLYFLEAQSANAIRCVKK